VNPTYKIQHQPHLPDGFDQARCGQDQPKENTMSANQKDFEAIVKLEEENRKLEEAAKHDPVQ